MNRRLLITSLVMVCGIANAQNHIRDFEMVRERNLWNRGDNVTGIAQDSTSVSYAEIYASGKSGGFHRYGDASSFWRAGAVAESIRHIGKISYTGKFAFEQWQGNDMYGSMFIQPGFYPIDVLEFTPGVKSLQKYVVDGGLSYNPDECWRVGVAVDFNAMNLAKRKDLRHTNYRLDVNVRPAFMWHRGDLAVGMSAILGKNSETVNAEVVGTVESTYYAFIDKGLMYGSYEGWEGSGVHLSEAGVNGLPLMEVYGGAAVQMSWKGLFAQLGYERSRGKAGEKDFIWYDFPADKVYGNVSGKIQGRQGEHFLRLEFSDRLLRNTEFILEKKSENGVTVVVQQAANVILRKNELKLHPEYEYRSNFWEIRWTADASWQRGVASQLYPYATQQDIVVAESDIRAVVHPWIFDVGAEVRGGKGILREKSRFIGGGDGTCPDRVTEQYDWTAAYIRTPWMGGSIFFKCRFWKGMYVKAEAGADCALRKTLPFGHLRWGGSVGLGYLF
ncbi:MAG: DUF6850 family outer membrane beta-barrel protein [Candidatus Cryptobacteroides sp.]